jgi:hypothetical protein
VPSPNNNLKKSNFDNRNLNLEKKGMKQAIWSSGTRHGTGKLRWCSTDKPMNVFWNWSKTYEKYTIVQNFLALKYDPIAYIGVLYDTDVGVMGLCEQN